MLPEQANCKHEKGLNRTCKVGSYKPNALGIYDGTAACAKSIKAATAERAITLEEPESADQQDGHGKQRDTAHARGDHHDWSLTATKPREPLVGRRGIRGV